MRIKLLKLSVVAIGVMLAAQQGFGEVKEKEFVPYTITNLKKLPPVNPNTVYGDKIRRTMHLLSTSTAEKSNKVKILFFGQSITRQNYSRRIIETKLRKLYPHAQLEVLNTAIGGYQADRSIHIMHHNLIHHQPDLVVFHVYGKEKDYEEVLRKIRKYTTAEMINVTHHFTNYSKEMPDINHETSQVRRKLAKKYDSDLIEVRKNWAEYLNLNNLTRPDLLKDKIHLNDHGGELWGELQARHFEVQPTDPALWQHSISRIDLSKGRQGVLGKISYDENMWEKRNGSLQTEKSGASMKITFEGTRVDVISRTGSGVADILIDGKKCTEFAETWGSTLPTKTPFDYRPTIMRVDLKGKPVAERWTLTAYNVSRNGREFSFSLKGSVSGEQGVGDHTAIFTSENGVIELDPKVFDYAFCGKQIPDGATTTWDVFNTGLETWNCSGSTKSNPSGQVTLVQQLKNEKHVLEIVPKSGTVSIDQVIIYKPTCLK